MKKTLSVMLAILICLTALTLVSCAKCKHVWDDGVDVIKVTCNVDGLKTYTCIHCGQNDSRAIPATGHNFSTELYSDNGYHWQECACGEIKDKEAHIDSDGKCFICNRKFYTGGLNYTEIDGGEAYAVSGYSGVTEKCVVIPATHSGKPVTEIAKDAFKDSYGLISVEIPDSVTTIKTGAFVNSGIVKLIIGAGVKTVENKAFEYCMNLIEVFNKSNQITVKVGGGEAGAYAQNVYTKYSGKSFITVTDNGYYIYEDIAGKMVIAYSGNEIELTVPDGVTKIRQLTYYNDTIKSVTLPISLNHISSGTFKYLNALERVIFLDAEGWVTENEQIPSESLLDQVTAKEYLTETYWRKNWMKN